MIQAKQGPWLRQMEDIFGLSSRTSTSGGGRTIEVTDDSARVLYVEGNEDGTTGGSHQRLYRLVTHLPTSKFSPVVLYYEENRFVERLHEVGVEVEVWESIRNHEHEVRQSGGTLRKWLDFLLAIVRRRQFLTRQNISLVHLNNSPWSGNDDWLPACRLAGIPVVANGSGGSKAPEPGRVQGWLARRFDGLIANSKYIRDGYVSRGFDPDRTRVVYPGVDAEEFNAKISRSPSDVRSELDTDPDQLLALMVGNIRHWKGQHVVLDALSRLDAEEKERVVLAFAGSPTEGSSYQDRILGLIREHGLEDHVRLLGFREDVPDLYNAADLAIHASVKPEPLGNVVIEAMTVGTPVVASAAGGPVELVSDESGWLFDTNHPNELANILRWCLEKPGMLKDMGEKARERADKFSLERYVSGVEEAYRDLGVLEIER